MVAFGQAGQTRRRKETLWMPMMESHYTQALSNLGILVNPMATHWKIVQWSGQAGSLGMMSDALRSNAHFVNLSMLHIFTFEVTIVVKN